MLSISSILLKNKTSDIQAFSALTTLPGFALSVEYFEPRNRFYADEKERLFVNMRPINTMDFIYAK